MTCRAGQSSFVVNWSMMIRSCIVLDQPSYDAFDTTDDFTTLWNKIVKEKKRSKQAWNVINVNQDMYVIRAAQRLQNGDSGGCFKIFM